MLSNYSDSLKITYFCKADLALEKKAREGREKERFRAYLHSVDARKGDCVLHVGSRIRSKSGSQRRTELLEEGSLRL